MRSALLLALALALAGCGQAAPAPTATPDAPATPGPAASVTPVAPTPPQATALPKATAVAAPTATPSAATAVPTIVPTPSPSPTPAPVALAAHYACDAGLCSAPLDGSQVSTLLPFDPEQLELAGLAASADGRQVVYGLGDLYEGQATLYSVEAAGGAPRRLFDIQGAESGAGGLEGFGALGFADGGRRIVFEDQAQVFAAAPDGSGRQAVSDQALYGASSRHWYGLSPAGGYLYRVGSGSPNFLTIWGTSAPFSATVELGPGDVPAAFLDEGQTLLVTALEPPLDEIEGNPATRERTLTGYATYTIATGARAPVELGRPGASGALPALASNVVGGAALVQDEQGQLWLARLGSAAMEPVALPGLREGGPLVLAIAP